VIDESSDADTAGESDDPAQEEREEIDRGSSGRRDMHGEPLGDEVSEDDEDTGQGKGDQRERDQEEGTTAALPEGPAIDGKVVGATEALHERCQNAGGTKEADDEGEAESVGGSGGLARGDEVALQQGADVRRQDAIEEDCKLKTDGSGIGEHAGNSRCDDERREERDHRGVGGGLGEVEAVMPHCTKQCAVKSHGKAKEPSHGRGPQDGYGRIMPSIG